MTNSRNENGPAPGATQVRDRWGAMLGAAAGLVFVWRAMAQINTSPGEHSPLFVATVPVWCGFSLLVFVACTLVGWYIFDDKPRGKIAAPQPNERGADSGDSADREYVDE